MAVVTKAVLKTYFETGDIPTQGQYVDLIDSQFGLGEAGITQIIQGTISASSAEIEDMTFKKLHLPGNGIDSMKVGTTFRIGRTFEVSGSLNVTKGNITITSSGEFQGPNANITNISGSFISASGHIYSAGNISASGHISGSATSTGSFGRIEVADRIGHAQDQNTAMDFNSDTITFTTNNVENAKFGTTNMGSRIGNVTYKTHLTGSTIEFKGNITASGGAQVNGQLHTGGIISASAGIEANLNISLEEIDWANGLEINQEQRNFQVKFNSIPAHDNKTGGYNHTGETMILVNPQIKAQSVVLIQQSAIFNSQGTFVTMEAINVIAGRCQIIFHCVASPGYSVADGGSVQFNFTIL